MLVSFKTTQAAESRYLNSFKKTIHYCYANVDRDRALNTINPHLQTYKSRLITFMRGYTQFFVQDFKKELDAFQTIQMNRAQRNSFIVDNLMNDFETVVKQKLDNGEAASLTGHFSRQLASIKRTFKTDVLLTKTYKTKRGNTVTLPIFYTADGDKVHPVMAKLVGQFDSHDKIANDIVNYASRVDNVQYLPMKVINATVNRRPFRYELRELVKAFYSPVRNREGMTETCRAFFF